MSVRNVALSLGLVVAPLFLWVWLSKQGHSLWGIAAAVLVGCVAWAFLSD